MLYNGYKTWRMEATTVKQILLTSCLKSSLVTRPNCAYRARKVESRLVKTSDRDFLRRTSLWCCFQEFSKTTYFSFSELKNEKILKQAKFASYITYEAITGRLNKNRPKIRFPRTKLSILYFRQKIRLQFILTWFTSFSHRFFKIVLSLYKLFL